MGNYVVTIVLDFTITAIAYLLLPILIAMTGSPLELKKIKRIIIINGIAIWLLFNILMIEIGISGSSGASVFLWSYVGYRIVKRRCYIPKETDNEHPQIHSVSSSDHDSHICISKAVNEPLINEYVLDKNTSPSFQNSHKEEAMHTEEFQNQFEYTKKKRIIGSKNIVIVILSILVVVFAGLNIFQYTKAYKNPVKFSWNIESDNSTNSTLTIDPEYYQELLDFHLKNDAKVTFMDNNIVFVIKGYGNYYYTYDQMKEVTKDDEQFEYWIYSKKQAASLGYNPY